MDGMHKIILFGAGGRTEYIISKLKENIFPILILDNDSSKWGKKVCGIKVCDPRIVSSASYEYVVIVPYDYYEIQKQLINLGVIEDKIVNCTHYEAVCIEEKLKKYDGKYALSVREKKSILAFSHSLVSTGAQNVLVTMLVSYMHMGFEVTIISTEDGELRQNLLESGITVYILPDFYTHKELINDLLHSSDLVIVNTLWMYYVIEDFVVEKIKTIWWIHESLNIEYIDKRAFDICNDKNVEICAVSEVVKDAIYSYTKSNLDVKILRFGLPYYSIDRIEHQKINIIVLAALAYIKGQDVFCEAVRELPYNVRKKAEFYFIGGGKRNKDIVQMAKELGIHIIDAIPHDKVYTVYEMADVIVCPSRKEAMSVTVVEAMMNGIMTIVSDAAGVANYIEHGKNGMIFKSEDSHELACMLEQVIINSNERILMGNQGRYIYDEFFSMNEHNKNLLAMVNGGNEDV